MRKIKTILFDLDGTLLNRDASVPLFLAGQYERLYEWLQPIPKENYLSRFIELDCRGYVWKDIVYQQLVKDFKIQGVTWNFMLEDYLTYFKNSCVPFPNLIHILEVLKSKSIRLGLITNGMRTFQMDNIKALGIEKYFDCILISESEGIKKPNPEIFIKAIEQLGVSAKECMYVGDHPENDVKGSKNVGMLGVWKRDPQWEQAEADFIIDDLLDLLELISK
ncbi:HAD family hydrolase [Pseudoneobacillus sp. C159]